MEREGGGLREGPEDQPHGPGEQPHGPTKKAAQVGLVTEPKGRYIRGGSA